MKTETQTRCNCPNRKGALFSVPVSRLEELLGHRKYECDQCHDAWKFTGPPHPGNKPSRKVIRLKGIK